MRVLYITNIPSPYRVDFFNELGELCDLTVVFEKKTSDERDKSWGNYKFEHFKGIVLNGKSISTDKAICPSVIRYVRDRSYDHIIVANLSSPTGIIATIYMKKHQIPYWIEGDGGFASPGNGIKNKLKTYMISNAQGCFSTSKVHDEYYLAYGASNDSIYRYPFTSIKNEDLDISMIPNSDKQLLRTQLGMREKKIIVSVGRFSYENGYGKGFDVLMKVASYLGDDYGIYIIGDNPTTEFLEWKERENLHNVHFISFLSKEELADYYSCADCFILLTRGDAWGLVINEAMVYGLPIITTPYCIAGTELVKNGKNGFIVDIDNPRIIADRIEVATKESSQEEFGLYSRKIISFYTIEKMAIRHIDILTGMG